jgi:hypothetical protein
MWNFFSSAVLFDNQTKKKITYCGTVRPNRKSMPQDLGHKKMKLKCGDIQEQTSGDLMVVVWGNKRDIHMLINIHNQGLCG